MNRHEIAIKLRLVSKSDYRFLYNLLKERDPSANISHKKMPTYHKQIGNIVLKKLIQKNPKKRYLANVSPKNKNSINFFKKNKFRLIQYTFELNNKI